MTGTWPGIGADADSGAGAVAYLDADTVAYLDADATAGAEFDETTHTWTMGGARARVIVSTDGTLPAASSAGDAGLPYLGVAVHGVPNYFLITGPDVAAQKGYIARCLDLMARSGATRIEVRLSAQRYYNDRSSGRTHRGGRYWRRVGRRIPSAFDVRSLRGEDGPEDTVYDGPATLAVDDRLHRVQVRLAGHLDPIDGHYHWQGTVLDPGFDVRLPREVTVRVGDRTALGRLTERTPWSTFTVTGVGAPPFALDDVEVEVPLR